MQGIGDNCSLLKPDLALWLSGPGSTRQAESALRWISAVRDLRFSRRFGNNFCRRAGFAQNAQASVTLGNEPDDGNDYGHLSDPLDILGIVDRIATGDGVELGRSFDQFCNHRRILLFCP